LRIGLRDCAEAESRADEEGTKHARNSLEYGGIGCREPSCEPTSQRRDVGHRVRRKT
jgi:hypothetical protein